MRRELLLLALVGCQSFDSVDAPAESDGGAGDARAPDTSDDASSVDAGADAQGGRFCERFVPPAGEETTYCRDFDDGRSAVESWSTLSQVPDASSVALDEQSLSRPFSFRARIEPNAAGCTYARGVAETGPMRSTSHVSFDVLLGGADTNANDGASFVTIQSGTCALIFAATPSKAEVHAQGGGKDVTYDMIDRYPRFGTWSHLEVTLLRDTNELEVAVDGMSALVGGRVQLIPGCLDATSKLQIQLGLYCEQTVTSAREVRIDNAVVTGAKP